MTREQLNNTLKEEFAKVKGLNNEHKKAVAANAERLLKVLEKRKPIDSKYVHFENSRYKVTMLQDFKIIISDLNEKQSKILFEKICQSIL